MTSYITYPNPFLNLSENPLTQVFIYGSTVTNGLLAPVMLACTFLVLYMTFQNQPFKDKAVVAALFVVFIESVVFWATEVAPFYYAILCMIALAAALYMSSRWHSD